MARLKEKFAKEVAPAMMQKFNYTNVMEIPKLEKVIINIGLGEATQNPKILDGAVADLKAITGQKPVITKAKKSIAAFKLREGMSVGTKVTLRSEKMYDLWTNFKCNLPRVQTLGCIPQSLDGRGNYNLMLKTSWFFPRLNTIK